MKRKLADKNCSKAVLFLAESCGMLLELAASYLFSPYFGNSHAVWTGIIGVILLSNAIGNYAGGVLAEKKIDFTEDAFFLSSVLVSLMVLVSDVVCVLFLRILKANALSALAASFVVLFPTEVLLGTISPQIMALQSKKGEKEIGKTYTASTIGGLFGTFVGGYFLIPYIGVSTVVVVVACVCFLLGVFSLVSFKENNTGKRQLFPLKNGKRPSFLATALSAIAIAVIFLIKQNGYDAFGTSLVFDSEYNRILISDAEKDGEPIRQMEMAAGFQSATYLEEGRRNDILFPYIQAFADMVEEDFEGDLLLVGGAAYQFPKWVLAYREGASIDVVEIDGKVTELARQYFFLDDCLEEFDENGERFANYTEDAKVFLARNEKQYDAIFMDAFSGREPVRSLTTLETILQVKHSLKDGGIYVLNIVGGVTEENAAFLLAESATLSKAFLHVYIEKVGEGDEKVCNYRVVASDRELPLSDIGYDYSDALVLTDDYCPIDSLTVKDWND